MTRIQIPDPSLVLLIGPAGAGKSTFASRQFHSTAVVSSDYCRAMICDDEEDQNINQQAFELLHHIVELRLSLGKLTVIDATNLYASSRWPLLDLANGFGIPVIALVFRMSLDTCLENNRNRKNRFVDEDAIRQQAHDMTDVMGELEDEGYQAVYELDETNIKYVEIVKY